MLDVLIVAIVRMRAILRYIQSNVFFDGKKYTCIWSVVLLVSILLFNASCKLLNIYLGSVTCYFLWIPWFTDASQNLSINNAR